MDCFLPRAARVAALLAIVPLVSFACGGAAPSDERTEPVATARSAIIDGDPSTHEDDFVVFVSQAGKTNASCGGALVAPNLVVTAKHCVNDYDEQTQSFCDATGEPQAGSTGGYITKAIPLIEIGIHTGVDAKKRFVDDGAAPAARAKQLVDDKTPTLCSHDFAFVVLDKPIEGVKVARLRLGKRPEAGSSIAVAGWGQLEKRTNTKFRFRRTGIPILRVGLPVAPPDASGSLAPRTFETGPGACSGDSGSPGFDLETGAVLGVVARALGLVKDDLNSPCRPESVINVYAVVADFPKELREAFAAANAEPWLEGRPGPGYLRFGDVCSGDLECEGGRCAGAGAASGKTCNLDCTKLGATCPSGYGCGASGACELGVLPPSTSSGGEAPVQYEEEPAATTSSCATTPGTPGEASPLLIGACALLLRRMKLRPRRRARP